jgi:carbon monoxide dehydrogenase subunit G
VKGGDWVTKLTKSIEIEASPEKVFAFLTDMEKMNEINKGFSEFEYTSTGPVGVGTTMHYVGKAGGSETEWDMEMTEFEKNKKMSMRTIGKSKFKMQQSVILEPTAKGTKATYVADYTMPYSILGKIVDKLRVQKDIEKSIEKNQRDVKKALET